MEGVPENVSDSRHTIAQPEVVTLEHDEPIRYDIVDSHLHLLDFSQRTDGAQALIEAMDNAGVSHAMVCGMSLVKKWAEWEPCPPEYYLDDNSEVYWYSATDALVAHQIISLPEEERRRLHPFICGINCTDQTTVDHVLTMLEMYPEFWQGIGEVLTRHDDLTALTLGEPARANHTALNPVYELAAVHDLPVCLHSDLTSAWRTKNCSYLHEMEEAVKEHPRTKFIWAHMGINRRLVVPTILEDFRRLLSEYLNLYVDLSWVVFDNYVIKDDVADPDWVALIEEFPDRFMIGSDVVGRFDDYVPLIQRYYLLLDELSPETAQNVAQNNFLNLLPGSARGSFAQERRKKHQGA